MNNLKTKEASELLGVSQTTVKRWASHYPSTFRKDSLGHYMFSGQDVNLLLHIKDQIELGRTLDQISLPGPSPLESIRKAESFAQSREESELMSRIREVERSLQQKADEVVSAQVLQHRSELDELRQMVAQLAATVENLQSKNAKPGSIPNEDFRLPSLPSSPSNPPKKKGFFRRH
ncbi:MerR family transcriptional regulator [Cohnella endophytica]|uniref:MerR family transcriptional regulator n=1 Tax=Cohnella endophytica TaxID=2419778 RepID=A0A494XLS0_9BACL|nr:MerR family transcriptional regulator [Cohnella endophytica]RKP51645.1 MerR family transcriptional regulator [Cohnella endophytica]